MRKPNLFVVGPPRSGTSPFYALLGQHPDIFMSSLKEPNYFSQDEPCVKEENGYLALFQGAGNERIVGEASTTYFSREEVPGKIKQFNPEARILVILREPAERVRSLYNHETYGQSISYLEYEKKTLLPKNAPIYHLLLFEQNLKRYYEHFGNNLKVILYDEFRKDNVATVKKVYSFLGVDPDFTPKAGLVNEGGSMGPVAGPIFRFFRSSFGGIYANPAAHKLIAPPYRKFKKRFLREKKPVSMSKELEEALSKDWEKSLEFCREKKILL